MFIIVVICKKMIFGKKKKVEIKGRREFTRLGISSSLSWAFHSWVRHVILLFEL